MTRKLITTMLLAGVALLASAAEARCDEKKDQQNASNSTQSTTNEQQKSTTDNSNAANTSTSSQSTQSNANTNASQSDQNQTNASSNTSSNTNDSNANTDRQSTSNPALPAPSNSSSDSNRSQDQSATRDSDKSNQTQAETQKRADDNRARSDECNGRSNDRDRDSRDFKAGIQIGRASGRGITVNTVRRGTIFYDSGLRDGDVIVSYNRRPIRSRDDFDRFVVYQRGERIPVVVLRDGREQTIYITYRDDVTRERSYISSDRSRGAYFGAEFDPQINDAVIVVRVDKGSPADRAGLQRDDVVLSLNGKKVASGKEANDMIASMNAGDRVEVEYSRHARTDAVLTGGRDSEVATRTSEDRVETSRDTSVETRDSDSRQYNNSSRDSNYRDRGSNDRSQGRGIFGRRR